MAGVVVDLERRLKQMRYAPAGPQRCLVAQRFGPLLEQFRQALKISALQPRLASSTARLLHRLLAALVEFSSPAAHGLTADLELTGNLRVIELASLQQCYGLHAPLLERIEITPYSGRVTHTESNPLSRRKCRYIMRNSIVGIQGNKIAEVREKRVTNKATGTFEIVMQRANWGGENVINLEVELVFEPTPAEVTRVSEANKKAAEK